MVLLASAVTGAGLAASRRGRSLPPVHRLRLDNTTREGFLAASAVYLDTTVKALHREMHGRDLAEIANETSGRSARQLATLLTSAAVARLQYIANRALSNEQARLIDSTLRRQITGFLNDRCSLAGVAQDLGGCPGMTRSGPAPTGSQHSTEPAV